jgi:hypothetical protein
MRQKAISNFTAGLVTIVFILGSTLSWAGPPDNYTAKIVAMGVAMPMAKMGTKTRVENVMMGNLITINLMDQKKTLILNTKNKTYFEKAMEDKVPSIHDPRTVIEKKKIGNESFDGHPCIKYEAVFYLKDKPQDKFNALIWEAQDLGGLTVRSEVIIPESKKMGGSGKMVTEFKEIKVGGATAAMFEVPKDFKKANSMNEVMGMGQAGDMKDMKEMMKQMQKMKQPKMPKEQE